LKHSRKSSHYLLLFLAALLLAPAALHAQFAVYGEVGGAAMHNAPIDLGFGPIVGVYKQTGYAVHTVSAGLDLRGSFMGRSGFHYNTVAVGPRISFSSHVLPLHPYVEGLLGIANYNGGSHTSSVTHFNYQVVGGLDTTILPHVDWRVVDISYSAAAGQDIHATTFATGFVFRLW
jgi:hypothetical protein